MLPDHPHAVPAVKLCEVLPLMVSCVVVDHGSMAVSAPGCGGLRNFAGVGCWSGVPRLCSILILPPGIDHAWDFGRLLPPRLQVWFLACVPATICLHAMPCGELRRGNATHLVGATCLMVRAWQAGAVGNATLQNFPATHFSRWGGGGALLPARRNSLVSNSEISAASDDDEAPPAVHAPATAAAAATTESSAVGAGRRQPMSNDAIIDVALAESAA